MRFDCPSLRKRRSTFKTGLLSILVGVLLQSTASKASDTAQASNYVSRSGSGSGSGNGSGSGSSSSNGEIGQLSNVSGEVQVRLPRKVRFTNISAVSAESAPFYAQEMLATHGAKSEALLTMESGAVIRVLGNSRVVAERDPNHDDAIFFTILSGDVELKKASSHGRLHFSRDGREIEVKVGHSVSLIPVIGRHSSRDASASADITGSGSSHSVVATVPDEPRVSRGSITDATPASKGAAISAAGEREKSAVSENGSATGSTAPGSTSNSAKSERVSPNPAVDPAPTAGTEKGVRYTLGNDDITKQIKSQASFFQRCYLNFLTRVTTPQSKTAPAGSGPNGARVVVVGFSIQNTGRVTQTHIVRTDISDVTLEKCLTEVLGRTSFRSFAGDEIEVSEYPILLE